ncbi:MAG: hypothetical protein ACJAQ4_000985 [Cryomorphaceae bacterium]
MVYHSISGINIVFKAILSAADYLSTVKYLFEIMVISTLILFGFALYGLIQVEDFSWSENRSDISFAFLSGLIAFNFAGMLRKKRKEKAANESEEL